MKFNEDGINPAATLTGVMPASFTLIPFHLHSFTLRHSCLHRSSRGTQFHSINFRSFNLTSIEFMKLNNGAR